MYDLTTPDTPVMSCVETDSADPVGATWDNGGVLHWDGTAPYRSLRVVGAGDTDCNRDYPLISVDDYGGFYWRSWYLAIRGMPGDWSLCIYDGGCYYGATGDDPTTAVWTTINGRPPLPTVTWI